MFHKNNLFQLRAFSLFNFLKI